MHNLMVLWGNDEKMEIGPSWKKLNALLVGVDSALVDIYYILCVCRSKDNLLRVFSLCYVGP